MVMVGHIMGVSMISIHHVNNFVVSMAVAHDLSLMGGSIWCKIGQIVRNHARIGRQNHAHR